MESKYILEVEEDTMTYRSGGNRERDLNILNAAIRLQNSIRKGNTLVTIRVVEIKA